MDRPSSRRPRVALDCPPSASLCALRSPQAGAQPRLQVRSVPLRSVPILSDSSPSSYSCRPAASGQGAHVYHVHRLQPQVGGRRRVSPAATGATHETAFDATGRSDTHTHTAIRPARSLWRGSLMRDSRARTIVLHMECVCACDVNEMSLAIILARKAHTQLLWVTQSHLSRTGHTTTVHLEPTAWGARASARG